MGIPRLLLLVVVVSVQQLPFPPVQPLLRLQLLPCIITRTTTTITKKNHHHHNNYNNSNNDDDDDDDEDDDDEDEDDDDEQQQRNRMKRNLPLWSNELWKNGQFRIFLISMVVSHGGEWVSYIGCIRFVEEMYPDAYHYTSISILILLRLLPNVILSSTLGGVLADAHDRRNTMIVLECVGAINECLYLLAIHLKSMPLLYVLFFVTETIEALYHPSCEAILPMLVHNNEQLLEVAATVSGASYAMVAAFGATLGGFIVLWFGMRACFVISTLACLFSACLMSSLRGSWIAVHDEISISCSSSCCSCSNSSSGSSNNSHCSVNNDNYNQDKDDKEDNKHIVKMPLMKQQQQQQQQQQRRQQRQNQQKSLLQDQKIETHSSTSSDSYSSSDQDPSLSCMNSRQTQENKNKNKNNNYKKHNKITKQTNKQKSYLSIYLEGIQYILFNQNNYQNGSHNKIRSSILMKATGMILYGATEVLVVSFSDSDSNNNNNHHHNNNNGNSLQRDTSSARLGTMYGFYGIGCVVGTIGTNYFTDIQSPHTLQGACYLSFIVIACSWMGMAYWTSFVSRCFFMTITSCGSEMVMLASNLLLMKFSKKRFLGRVTALDNALAVTSDALSAVIAGLLLDHLHMSAIHVSWSFATLGWVLIILWGNYFVYDYCTHLRVASCNACCTIGDSTTTIPNTTTTTAATTNTIEFPLFPSKVIVVEEEEQQQLLLPPTQSYYTTAATTTATSTIHANTTKEMEIYSENSHLLLKFPTSTTTTNTTTATSNNR